MPFLRVEPVTEFWLYVEQRFADHTAIVRGPGATEVAATPVRFLRGHRYLQDRDAPPDMYRGRTVDVSILDQMGFVE